MCGIKGMERGGMVGTSVHGVRKALMEYMVELQKYEGYRALQTENGKRFYALIQQCAEEVLVSQMEYVEWKKKYERGWVTNEVGEGEATERIREKIRQWLVETRTVMPRNAEYATGGFEALCQYVDSFCAGESVTGVAAVAEALQYSGSEVGGAQAVHEMLTCLKKLG
jgi:hypothetical protein